MNKTSIMTLRVPIAVRRSLDRLAGQLGYKSSHLGARLVEEGIRRRHFPQVDLRETAVGRVAYLKGTRLAVYWIVERVRKSRSAEAVAQEFDLSSTQVNSALAYANAFPAEIESDLEEVASNKSWLEHQEAAWKMGHPATKPPVASSKSKSRK
jgi:uncharacterized protein (DUF433 family)